jgi:2-oxo-4-hydroxy-4-carboxy-5-ureidoimidazoline decarboxylase
MRPSALPRADFLARFGGVYEASPWVAEAVWPAAAAGTLDDPEAMTAAMRAVVDGATREMRLALIRAHPELASRTRMAQASVKEQAGAGLDACGPEEFAAFQQLNGDYAARFGHPFIIAVKGLSRTDILAAFATRLGDEPATEFETAMTQIHRIASLRLADLFAED